MHTKGIIHRDIKPENIVIDSDGYVRITDLGIARIISGDNAYDSSGSMGYMGKTKLRLWYIAPEVICQQNHGVAVDYFALGVLSYELMLRHVLK